MSPLTSGTVEAVVDVVPVVVGAAEVRVHLQRRLPRALVLGAVALRGL